MPILRHEIHSFPDTYNAYRIRAQLDPPNYVPGIPNKLYSERRGDERIGFRPNHSLLDSLITTTTGYNANAYLSEATLA